ncbi:MAG: HEAT repeat domain-containing protein [Planctomycetes bacterium]|nr:HEAT repeat domain-containing protein [Planctomycetota bacterium]
MVSHESRSEPPRYVDRAETVSADDVLPPVEAPTVRFLLQLFFVPLVIVVVIVVIWSGFSWVVQSTSDPADLVREIRALNDASWQKAYTLGDMLRNPEFHALREDRALASELARVLEQEVSAGQFDEQRVQLRVYLCRALGEFRIVEGAGALVAAARADRDPSELVVRRCAMEGLAVLAANIGAERLRDAPGVLDAVMEVSRERSSDDTAAERDALRATAAFLLGVLGGDPALHRLARLMDDAHANTRYNAATGLARHGDPRCERVLLEMLDPTNASAVEHEPTEETKERKRSDVLGAAISAAARYAQAAPNADLSRLREAVARLRADDLPKNIRNQALEADRFLSPSSH